MAGRRDTTYLRNLRRLAGLPVNSERRHMAARTIQQAFRRHRATPRVNAGGRRNTTYLRNLRRLAGLPVNSERRHMAARTIQQAFRRSRY